MLCSFTVLYSRYLLSVIFKTVKGILLAFNIFPFSTASCFLLLYLFATDLYCFLFFVLIKTDQ